MWTWEWFFWEWFSKKKVLADFGHFKLNTSKAQYPKYISHNASSIYKHTHCHDNWQLSLRCVSYFIFRETKQTPGESCKVFEKEGGECLSEIPPPIFFYLL